MVKTMSEEVDSIYIEKTDIFLKRGTLYPNLCNLNKIQDTMEDTREQVKNRLFKDFTSV